ncbi:kinesin-like protein KIF20B isoform X3 [Mya arenaria]|uniref:kinesin-like protein KIF20B isoform X3 n=1 Tax=Mya arenaria TaxID=6604 RepID=UPI0022E16685|nr:kinesin-like protein KIF20B isoform X3 [Mya arenaria]
MMSQRMNHRVTADIVPMDDIEYDEVDDIQPLPKRNLLKDFGRPSMLEHPAPNDHMPVYLRIRPFSRDELEKDENQDCFSVESERTVVTHPPKDSHFFKNMTRGLCKSITKYTFSQIFNENTTQNDFFNSTMLNYVKDFIDGQNCLVFSYGVTNSGKTYTIQGNPKDAGILPRALDVLFNSIGGRQWEGMNLKPQMFVDVTRLSQEQEQQEIKIKESILKLSQDDDMDVMSLLGDCASDISSATNNTACSDSSNISSMPKDSIDSSDYLFSQLETRVREDAKVSVDEQGAVKFSVWVSFAEIYNEQIYDLLVPLAKKKNARRTCLKLSEDRNGSPYIKDLKYVHVSSADEAYKLLTIGQRNLQVACTKLNHNSSRSHCIFNIKIVRVIDKDNPHVARVSMLTLCDLAGSERYSKTHNTGDRLKEAGNINNSLLTLGRCIETLRYNQAHKEHSRIIPFRESKLTRLFSNNFMGRGKAAMVVNVNQLASMFDETMHVFKFSAIASKVEVHQKPVFIKPKLPVSQMPAAIPRTSISWATPARNHKLEQAKAENVSLPDDDDDLEEIEESEEDETIYTQENIDELLGIIEQLQNDLQNEVHSKWKLEKQIRAQVCEEMMKQFSKIEEEHSERLRLREQRIEELADKRIAIIQAAERARRQELETCKDDDDEWVSSVVLHQEKVKNEQKDELIKELRKEIKILKSGGVPESAMEVDQSENVSQLEEKVSTLQAQLDKATAEMSNMEELKAKVTEYEEKIAALEKMSNKTEDAASDGDDGNDDVVENLTQQLQQAREHIKDQEGEISELNDMLTEAGETFEQKEVEITKLKELNTEYENSMEQQREAIKVLERAAADGKVAMETADQSLSKQEECVSTLQADIRELEGEVNKYRNKARFFEDQLVEKEQEASRWRSQYENAQKEYACSQDALIHGFNSEIANLKSQIFQYKAQICGVKSPSKSPGGSLKSPASSGKSPDVRMKLFPMSPLNTSSNSSGISSSPKESMKHDVNEQVKAIQCELNKNCKMVQDLEKALDASRSTNAQLERKIEELSVKKSEDESNATRVETSNASDKDVKIITLENKIKELEPLMKDYFSTSKKLTDSEKKLKEMNEKLDDKINQIIGLEEKVQNLEQSNVQLETDLITKEEAVNGLEKHAEELEILNKELKGMIDKTATDLESKEKEIKILSPKVEKMQLAMSSDKTENNKDALLKELEEKDKANKLLRDKLQKMKAYINAKECALKEATETCFEYEFKSNEKEVENEGLVQELEEKEKKIIDLDTSRVGKATMLKETGEELAVIGHEYEKAKRMIEEYKVSIQDLENALANKEAELIKQDKLLDDKAREIVDLKKKVDHIKENSSVLKQDQEKLSSLKDDNLKLEKELANLKEKMSEVEKRYHDDKEEVLKEMKDKVDELTDAKQRCEEKLELAEKENANLKEALTAKESEQQKYKMEKEKLTDKIYQEVEVVKNEMEEVRDDMTTIHEDLHRKAVELEDKNAELEALQASFNELKQSIEKNSTKEQLSSAMLEITELKSSLQKQKTHHHKVKGELEEALMTIESSKHEIENYKKEIDTFKELKEEVDNRNDELEVSENVISELREVIKRRDEQMEELHGDLRNLTKDQRDKEQKIKVFEEKFEKLETKLSGAELTSQKIEELETCLANESAKKSELEQQLDKVKGIEEKCLSLETKLAKAESKIEDMDMLEENFSQTDSKLEEAEQKLDKYEKEIKLLKEKLSASANELKEMRIELEERENALQEKEKNLMALDSKKVEDAQDAKVQLHTMEEENSKLKSEQVELHKQLEKMNKIEMDASNLKDVKVQLHNMEEENSRLKSEQVELHKQLEKMNKLETDVSNLKDVVQSKEQQIKNWNEKINSVSSQFNRIWLCIGQSNDDNSFENLDSQVDEVCEHLQNMQKRNSEMEDMCNKLSVELTRMKSKKHDNMSDLDKKVQTFSAEIQELKEENCKLKAETLEKKNVKEIENELKSQLTLKEVECETLTLEMKLLKEEHSTLKEKVEELEKRLKGDIDTVKEESEKSDDGCDKTNLEKVEELQRLYNAEKHKNEEYQKLLAETSEAHCMSPQTGVRKLRKEKIETENALLEAKYKIGTLEKKIADMEVKLRNATTVSGVVSTGNGVMGDRVQERRMNSLIGKVQELEEQNKGLIREVTQLQGDVTRLEAELSEEQSRGSGREHETPRRSRASYLSVETRQSISSPVSKLELNKSKEREQQLKDQLREVVDTNLEWKEKLAEIETRLQLKTQELTHARDTIARLEAESSESGRALDKRVQEYMDQNNELKLQILRKEGEIESKAILNKNLQGQLDSETGVLKSLENDRQNQLDKVEVLQGVLKEQEEMLEQLDQLVERKETELQNCEADYREIRDKYQALLEKGSPASEDSKVTEQLKAERDMLKHQVKDNEVKLDEMRGKQASLSCELKECQKNLKDAEKQIAKLNSVVKENNEELKALECSLTESRKREEDLHSQGTDKMAATHIEEMKRDTEKAAQELQAKIRDLKCQKKEVTFQLQTKEKELSAMMEEKATLEKKLQDFRVERDKLVEGLEAVLKKKDSEVKQLKDIIKQQKEKEMQITQCWQDERAKIASNLQELNHTPGLQVKPEPKTPISPPQQHRNPDPSETPVRHRSPVKQNSRNPPPRPSPPKSTNQTEEETPQMSEPEIQTFDKSPGSQRRRGRTTREGSTSEESAEKSKRGSSRRGKKRPSSEGLENLPPVPKRQSRDSNPADTSAISESDDYSSHVQVDATPPVAAKTMRRTRKRNGSTQDLSKNEENEGPRRPQRASKRSAKHRLLESFRESPMGRTSKRILDSISETFSPNKSPNKSPVKSPLREDNSRNVQSRENSRSRENVGNDPQSEKKSAGRGRGKHRLYKEETFISEPMDTTKDFVTPPDIHQTVTRSLRSRRH